MKKFIYLSLASFLVLGIVNLSWAMGMMCAGKMHTAVAQTTEETTQEKIATDVGNKICPISGEKIDEKMKTTYEYEGKIYNFCCAMCIEEFKKDPEKYIKKVEEELQTGAEEEKKMLDESEPPEGTHTGHHH